MRHPLLTGILLTLSACVTREDGVACQLALSDTCPDPADLSPEDLHDPWDCDNKVAKILSTQTPEVEGMVFQSGDNGCCYEVVLVDRTPNSECIVGRPFRDDGVPIASSVPVLEGAAAAWGDIGRAEHASVAAFAKLTLELMALGAPTALLEQVARAQADEVQHAAAAFAIATRLAGRSVTPGPFPFPGAVDPRITWRALAVAAVHEGCVGETLSAIATREAADQAIDVEIRSTLQRIADDEDRHARLSWAIVSLAIRRGGQDVRTAVVEAFRAPVVWQAPVDTDALAAWGVLGPSAMRAVAERGLREVIAPAATALLAA